MMFIRIAKKILKKLRLPSQRIGAPQPLSVENQIAQFKQAGSIPWQPGYVHYQWQQIEQAIRDDALLATFREDSPLPANFGWRVSERIIEYPWVFAHLTPQPGRLLDAGSTLNFDITVDEIVARNKQMTIFTLAPERQAFWQKHISYQFGDLRNMPFRDNWFDEIVCISTLEHIGFDNRPYGENKSAANIAGSYEMAVAELWRVLKPGGTLLITVPYGKPQLMEWTVGGTLSVFSQQFGRAALGELVGCLPTSSLTVEFFQYVPDGWQRSSQDACDDAEYFNIHTAEDFDSDYAAAARAVACIKATK